MMQLMNNVANTPPLCINRVQIQIQEMCMISYTANDTLMDCFYVRNIYMQRYNQTLTEGQSILLHLQYLAS